MGKEIKMVVFDLDGTLVDAFDAVTASLNYAFEKMDYPLIDYDTAKRSVGEGDLHLVKKFVSDEDAERTLEFYREHHKDALGGGTKFLPGVEELLENLEHNGTRMAIATNRPFMFTEIILEALNIYRYFEHVVSPDFVKNPKPDPEMLEYLLKKTKLGKDEVLFVGDMTFDVETGNRAGVDTVAVLTGSSTKEEIEEHKPLMVVENILEVLGIVSNGGLDG